MPRLFRLSPWIALGAAPLVLVIAAVFAAPAPSLDQGWTAAQQTSFYQASQGSRLLPLAWLKALEQPGGSGKLFLDNAYVASFRYLPSAAGAGLPVGFAVDVSDEADLSTTKLHWRGDQGAREPWVGLNCAACHTSEITYRGRTLRIDGGPTLADFQSFFEALDLALTQTRDDPAKFNRFAGRVLGGANTAANQAMLKAALASLVARRQALDGLNATPLRYGPGRLDAIGRIFNQMEVDLAPAQPTANPPNAPVSYPFLWNVPQQQRVEWDGLTPNLPIRSAVGDTFDAGALARNAGEVIGVFGDVTITPHPGVNGYRSSINVANLAAFEQLIGKLKPPRWPSDVFGAPDPALVQAGRTLFAARCASCHQALDRNDLKTRIDLRMSLFKGGNAFSPPGADIWMACNAYTAKAKSGVMQGTPAKLVNGVPFGAEAHATELLEVTVKGALAGKKWNVAQVAGQTFFGVERPPEVVQVTPHLPPGAHAFILSPQEQKAMTCMTNASNVLGYKIRPLTGIWATAPYLHDGSVPSLYDLLAAAGAAADRVLGRDARVRPGEGGLRLWAAAGQRLPLPHRRRQGPPHSRQRQQRPRLWQQQPQRTRPPGAGRLPEDALNAVVGPAPNERSTEQSSRAREMPLASGNKRR